MNYSCSSEAYLERAKDCLEEEDPRNLFYAAYELRCFVERRQQDYLEAQKEYRKSLPARWKIGKQSCELRRVFGLEKIQRITNVFANGFQFVSEYVPVSSELRTHAERLGELLHSQSTDLQPEKMEEMRDLLTRVFKAASECQSGNMLCPALVDNKKGKTLVGATLALSETDLVKFKEAVELGGHMTSNVEYVEFQT